MYVRTYDDVCGSKLHNFILPSPRPWMHTHIHICSIRTYIHSVQTCTHAYCNATIFCVNFTLSHTLLVLTALQIKDCDKRIDLCDWLLVGVVINELMHH